jgi:hypothetical protein
MIGTIFVFIFIIRSNASFITFTDHLGVMLCRHETFPHLEYLICWTKLKKAKNHLLQTPHGILFFVGILFQILADRNEFMAAFDSHIPPPCQHGIKPEVVSFLKISRPYVNILLDLEHPVFQ